MTPPTESLRELKSTLLTMAEARGFDALGVSDLELGADARNSTTGSTPASTAR
jgi:hypothetical protein